MPRFAVLVDDRHDHRAENRHDVLNREHHPHMIADRLGGIRGTWVVRDTRGDPCLDGGPVWRAGTGIAAVIPPVRIRLTHSGA
jgi:hypothetical protein